MLIKAVLTSMVDLLRLCLTPVALCPWLNIKIVSLGKLDYVHPLQCVHNDLKSYPAIDVTVCIEDQAPLLRVFQHLHDNSILEEMSLCFIKSSVIQKANPFVVLTIRESDSVITH